VSIENVQSSEYRAQGSVFYAETHGRASLHSCTSRFPSSGFRICVVLKS